MKKPSHNILIVDDEEGMRFFLSEALEKEGYHHRAVVSGEEAIKALQKEVYDLVILDHNLPAMMGLEVFKRIKEIDGELSVIMMTGYGDKNLAYDAMQSGVLDFFNKPIDVGEMRVVVRRALDRTQLQRTVSALRSSLQNQYGLSRIIGKSRGVVEMTERIKKVADSDVAVLILGESGTGKEIAAQAIHALSPRGSGPFIKVNCAAVPQELLEAEFFGFEKGSFTGAVKARRGKFEQANGGTILLDEIGDMPLATQTKILRVLQENELERVGGESPIKINIRLLASTHKDLQRAVQEGEFREDLFYRLNVVPLRLPPLRERAEDIPILARHFLDVYNEKFRRDLKGISPEGMALLQGYSWPGNIRELENVIQRGIILAYNETLGSKELLDVYPSLSDRSSETPTGPTLQDKVESVVGVTEKRLILEALKEENWKRQETADRLGISRKSLHNKMKKYGLGE